MTKQEFDRIAKVWETDMCFISNPLVIMEHTLFQTLFDGGISILPWVMEKIYEDCWIGWLTLAGHLVVERDGTYPFHFPQHLHGRLDQLQECWIKWWEKQNKEI